tara:strand:- start:566 stop:862 length:297 start_codon:yes stop_codon:yes gene_type:complete
MKQTTNNHFQSSDPVKLELTGGMITARDSSDHSVSIYVGTKTLNEAVATYLNTCFVDTPLMDFPVEKYLIYCDRSTQERFIQVLNDHIRETDNAEVQS